MKRRFILYRRKRGGMFYVEDTETHKQESTGTRNRAEAIELIEKELKLRLDDAERIAVLQEVKSCDVQAGPGSGKTTILIAKLAILARKWPSHDRGICVVSHTNVARREIEKKLNLSPELRRLLHYPHFIGTIQTFVDQFLAIPFLRRERVEVTAIDNERFGARAWATFCKISPKGRFAIVNYCQKDVNRARSIVGSLRLDGAHMGVGELRWRNASKRGKVRDPN